MRGQTRHKNMDKRGYFVHDGDELCGFAVVATSAKGQT